jgi:triacylglycerol esterase/lipase EstA (alpha/beta hydrolase family)
MLTPRTACTAAVLALLLAVAGSTSAQAALPVVYSFPVALAVGVAAPNASPPGANDWSCHPGTAHPRPVVLVHGTFENQNVNWRALSPLLKNHGYCVFALNYGGSGSLPLKATGAIADSAVELSAFVDRVLAATGAAKVDIVGHSQGGMMPRQYLKAFGGAAKVATVVGLSPSNHGTTLDGIVSLAQAIPGAGDLLGALCPACTDQLVGSPFLQQLNSGGDTAAGVSYTVIATRYDEVVTPYRSAFLTGPGVTNITVQDGCPIDLGEHLAISYDRRALAYVLNALDPTDRVAVPCVPVVPLVGG